MTACSTPEQQFRALSDEFADDAAVRLEAGDDQAGSETLRLDGRIFAMLIREHLVVKLPAARVAELIEARQGKAFDAGEGRPMREWVIVKVADQDSWVNLSREARDFVQTLR
jgi:hypothetical protein